MNSIIQRKIIVTADWQPLNAERLVGTFDISCPPTNTDNVIFQGDDGSEVPWIAGEWHRLIRFNLADIQVKGTPGDIVTVVGGTW